MGWEPDAFGATASGLRHLPTFVALGKVYYRPKFAVICFRTRRVARDMNGFFLGPGKLEMEMEEPEPGPCCNLMLGARYRKYSYGWAR